MHSMSHEELARWFRDPGDLDVWEDIASWFHAETGHLRPGKDKPIGFHQTDEGESDCCNDSWIRWSADKRDEAVRGLLARVSMLEAIFKEAAQHDSWRCREYQECHCGLDEACDKAGLTRVPCPPK